MLKSAFLELKIHNKTLDTHYFFNIIEVCVCLALYKNPNLHSWFQVIDRHPSDPAFLLDAPFSDGQSELDVKYAIGLFPGGTDVLDWEIMEGPSVVILACTIPTTIR